MQMMNNNNSVSLLTPSMNLDVCLSYVFLDKSDQLLGPSVEDVGEYFSLDLSAQEVNLLIQKYGDVVWERSFVDVEFEVRLEQMIIVD